MTETEQKSTVLLLKECDSGTKMAVYAFDHVMKFIKNEKLRELMEESRRDHVQLGDKLHKKLLECHSDDEEPPAMGRIGAWVSTEVKLMMDDSDAKIAKIVSEGCHMGVNSLSHYMNTYQDADSESYDLCTELIKMEQTLMDDLRLYL